MMRKCFLCDGPLESGKRGRLQICNPCEEGAVESRPDTREEDRQARNDARWRSYVPSEYRNTVVEKLPTQKARELFPRFKNFQWRERTGLYLWGQSGRGKTRLAYEALHAAYRSGAKVRVVFAGELRAKLFSSFEAAEKMIQECQRPDVLLIDDLGQGAKLEQLDEILMTIIEKRSQRRKPNIVTTQFNESEMIGRFAKMQTGEAIARRLGKEYATVISL